MFYDKAPLKIFYSLLFLIIPAISFTQDLEELITQTEFKLSGDSISFPLTIINGYPFISGEVNGFKGKFMFDTGHQGNLSINNNNVPLPHQQVVGEGFFGSGQKFTHNINKVIDEVKLINGSHFQNIKQISSSNYEFLQNKITPDFLGFIGYNFYEGYLFKLDYFGRKITFYKNTSAREASKDFLNKEKVIAVVDFETRKLPNIPIVKAKVNDIELVGSFDTGGSSGSLEIIAEDADNLTKNQHLTYYGRDGADDNLYSLQNVKLAPELTFNLIGIYKEFTNHDSALRKVLGITEDNKMIFAYRFLAKYKTVWDYEHKKIYVLEY